MVFQIGRRGALVAATSALAAPGLSLAQAGPIRLGEINSYSAQPAFLQPYRNGWLLAQEEVNAAGGIGGRPIETIFRDDAGKPEDAVRHAGELVNAERVSLLSGGFLSNVGLAIADFALQNKRLFVASEPLTDALVWSKGNRYTFRLRASTYMQSAMLVEEAAKLPARKWAVVAPNYEYGQSAVRWFKELLTRAVPDVQFVAEQFPALGRIDAGATVQALAAANPEAIFNVTFGADLTNFVRQGSTRGLFEKRSVVSLLTGEPEYLDPLGDEAHRGAGDRTAGCRDDRAGAGDAVRCGGIPRHRPSIDHGRLCRAHRAEERQGHHGRLALRRRGQVPAFGRGGADAAPAGLRAWRISPCRR